MLFQAACCCMKNCKDYLPLCFRGTVIHGYGRGGKQLGCPTANLDAEALDALPSDLPNGVYAGFAKVDSGEMWPMVMSIGYNPHFNNTQKSLEVHILHEFPADFYGSRLEGIALSYIRPMVSYDTMEKLIDAIESDKRTAKKAMTDELKETVISSIACFKTG